MSLKQTKSRGFTIVELLIVIVVIAILAAITIVAYNGIQNRAKASAAQELANQVVKKGEAWNAIQSGYPTYCNFATNTTNATGTATGVGTAGCTAGATAGPAESKLDDPTDLRTTAATDQSSVQYQTCTGGGAKVNWVAGGQSGTLSMGVATGTCS